MSLNIAVAGASGYAAAELFRLLPLHPEVGRITAYSRNPAGVPRPPQVAVRPFEALFEEAADVVFLSLPADASREAAAQLAAGSALVIDLSGGHRLDDDRYREVYGDLRTQGAGRAPYGLTEWFRDALGGARLIANPGCYATAMGLLLFPLGAAGLKPPLVVADGISGHSGAGRAQKSRYLLAEASEDLSSYRMVGHPHVAEVEDAFAARFGEKVDLHFTPHLAPLSRGLTATVHLPLAMKPVDVHKLLADAYAGSPFVQVLPPGQDPHTRHLLGTNGVEISAASDVDRQWIVMTAALDNLGKGAAGQAIQNMNVALGLEEAAGLKLPAFVV